MAESLTLSPEHQKALQQGESVPAIETGTQIECVVVRADVFNRTKKLLPDFDPREAYSALDEVMKEVAAWTESWPSSRRQIPWPRTKLVH